ncbi:MAG: HAD-IA family hydrolase [Thermoanaerobaculia bacterium]
MNPAVVVFDLDGTLVDSRPDLTTAVNAVRRELALPFLDESAVGGMIGEGARVLVERALADAPPEVSRDRALAGFLEKYAAVCTQATRGYDGVDELLSGSVRRWPLAILTNKPIAMTRAIFGHLGWERWFRVVVGGDSLPFRKPRPEGLRGIASALDCRAEELLMIGDSLVDAETARAAGSQFVWVTWGYAAPETRGELGRESSAATPAALLAELSAIWKPRAVVAPSVRPQ